MSWSLFSFSLEGDRSHDLPIVQNLDFCLIGIPPTEDTFPGGGATLGISGWGCAAGTLEPLTYTRASSAEFCYPILE